MRVALFQQDVLLSDPIGNREKIASVLSHQHDCDLFILPEMFTTGFCTKKQDGMIVCDDGETLPWMIRMAKQYQLAIAGSVAVQLDESQRFNRFYFVHPDGKVCTYDKHHLFTYGHEDSFFGAGDRRVVVEYKGWRFLLQVCCDIRFPVFSRYKGDYDAIIYVANFPALRIEAWRSLIRARAIENQCYVMAVNRVGKDQVTDYNGYSAVIDAYGQTVVEADQPTECIVTAKLDLRRQNVLRKRFPVWKDADRFFFE
jgi:predicted amidohydrolase